MKTIYLVRHAKSSWDDPSLRDIDRPLSKRGLRDAPFMAKLLKGKGINPELFLSSPANRAFTTASFFAKEFGKAKSDILVKKEIYEAYSRDIVDIIKGLPKEVNIAFIFGHNPTFTSVANLFTDSYIPNMPTCSIVQIEAKIYEWPSFDERTGKVVNFFFPKQYL